MAWLSPFSWGLPGCNPGAGLGHAVIRDSNGERLSSKLPQFGGSIHLLITKRLRPCLLLAVAQGLLSAVQASHSFLSCVTACAHSLLPRGQRENVSFQSSKTESFIMKPHHGNGICHVKSTNQSSDIPSFFAIFCWTEESPGSRPYPREGSHERACLTGSHLRLCSPQPWKQYHVPLLFSGLNMPKCTPAVTCVASSEFLALPSADARDLWPWEETWWGGGGNTLFVVYSWVP